MIAEPGGFLALTPKATIVERSQLEIELLLAILRFENRSKLEELSSILKWGRHGRSGANNPTCIQ